jgi:arylsulfatase A-like enzyme
VGRHLVTRRRLLQAGGTSAAALAASGCFLDGDEDGRSPLPLRPEEINTLLIVTDSTRADYIGAYGGGRLAETPNIDALAKEGIRFTRPRPEAMPTVPVRRALLTGHRSYPFRDWKLEDKMPPFPGWNGIPAGRATFPEVMRRRGISTAYVTDNPFLIGPRFTDFRRSLDISESLYIQGEYRNSYNTPLPRGVIASEDAVARYLLPGLAGTSNVTKLREYVGLNVAMGRRREKQYAAARVIGAGMELLPRLKRKRPFFLGVDAFDPHEAFDPPPSYKRRFGDHRGVEPILPFTAPFSRVADIDITDEQIERVRELYAAEMTFVDAWIGRLLNKLDDEGLADSTAVVYVSDHGLYLGERGLLGKYAPAIHREIYDVPWIMRHPERRRSGDTSDWFASTHDVAPTLLGFHAMRATGGMDGEDLSVLFHDREPHPRPYWTTSYSSAVGAGDGRYLLVSDNQGVNRRLFDTRHDPRELRDVASAKPRVVDRLWRNVVDDAGGSMPVFGDDGVIKG